MKHFLSIVLIPFFLFSCLNIKKTNENFNFAVLISPSYLQKKINESNTSLITTSEGQVFSIIGKKKVKTYISRYKIKKTNADTNSQVYVIEKHQLMLFEEQEEAEKFAIQYRPFIGVYADISHPIQLHTRGTINSSHIGTIMPQTISKKSSKDPSHIYALKVINTIKKSAQKNLTPDSQYLPQSFWAYVQGQNEQKKVVRGWALISHQWTAQYIKFNESNITSLSLILSDIFIADNVKTNLTKNSTYTPHTLLLPQKTIELIKNKGLVVTLDSTPAYGFSIQNQNKLTQEFTIVNNIGTQVLPFIKIFPLNSYHAAFISSGMEITWHTTNTLQKIIVSSNAASANNNTFTNVTYIPISTKEIKIKNIQSNEYQNKIFRLLAKNTQWYSSLFGTISINDGSLIRALTWTFPPLSIPKTMQNIFLNSTTHATITTDYVPTGILKRSVDAIIAFKISQNDPILFALKTFSNRQFNLQMLPPNTPTDDKNIDVNPIGPIMSFSKK